MSEFPDWEDGKGFDEEEEKEMIEKAIPNSWLKSCIMLKLLDPEKTKEDLIQQCEAFEFAESLTNEVGLTNNDSGKNQKKRKRAESQTKPSAGKKGLQLDASSLGKGDHFKGLDRNRNTGKWCVLHKTDSHDTGDCKVLLAQANKMRNLHH